MTAATTALRSSGPWWGDSGSETRRITLRRTAVHFLEGGAAITDLQELLVQADLATTQV